MTTAFTFLGGSANSISKIISLTTPTVIVPASTVPIGQIQVSYIRCNEIAGSTPNLTVELFDVANAVSYYLGSGGFTWRAKALTALQSVLFDDGIVVPPNWQLRVTCSAGNQVHVVGVYVGRQTTSEAWKPNA